MRLAHFTRRTILQRLDRSYAKIGYSNGTYLFESSIEMANLIFGKARLRHQVGDGARGSGDYLLRGGIF